MQQYSIFFNHIPYSNQTLNEYKKTHPKRIYRSYTNPYKTDLDLNIYSGSYYCVNHGHDIEEVYIEVVDMIDGLKKTILVSHCKDCNKFFWHRMHWKNITKVAFFLVQGFYCHIVEVHLTNLTRNPF